MPSIKIGVAGLATALVIGTGGLGGPPAASAYSARSYDGILRTASTATGTASAVCWGSGGVLQLSFQSRPAPQWWHFAARTAGVGWTPWGGWGAVGGPSYTTRSLGAFPAGDYQFAIEIAYWNGSAWEYDAELIDNTNQTVVGTSVPGTYCHLGAQYRYAPTTRHGTLGAPPPSSHLHGRYSP